MQKNRSKWDINKVEATAVKFGTGAHITLPKTWLKKMVVAVTKDTWQGLQQK
ncbi:MAG: DUF2080 family transposase-associated protein [Candidatus Nitrosopolaris sp.]